VSDSPDNDGCSSRTRVVLVGCVGLLGDIIQRAVSEDPDVDVVGRLDASALTDMPTAAADIDLVLWHNADEAAVHNWMRRIHATPQVLTTIADGREASLWQLTPSRRELGALSPAALVSFIHAANNT
jgi:hypothetical protein